MRERLLVILAVLAVAVSFRIAHAEQPDPSADADALDDRAAAPIAQARFAHPTITGLTGGMHVVDAISAVPRTFRVSLHGEYFRKDGFVAPGDRHQSTGSRLSLNVTPLEHLELAAQLTTFATQSRAMEPEVAQVIGDIHLLAKSFLTLRPWLALGGDAALSLLNGVGDIGVVGAATSVGLRASATADLRRLARAFPLIARTNVRYRFDNSSALARETEDARYESLSNASVRDDEYRHLLSPSERYALQINRVDLLEIGIGVEVPLTPHERVVVRPLVEWRVGLPINRQGYDCVVTQAGERDSCLAGEGFAARPSQLTLGVRAQPYVRGLGVLLAIDVATSGHERFVRELAPTPRYLLHFGLSYAFDPRPPYTAPASARVEPVALPTPMRRGHIVGRVVDGQTGVAIAEAIVHFPETQLSEVLTDEDGVFRSAELAPGTQPLEVRKVGYRATLCAAELPQSGDDVTVRCELVQSARTGQLRGRVMDHEGKPLAGVQIGLQGPVALDITSNADGTFVGDKIPAGRYALRVEAAGHFPLLAAAQVEAGQVDETPALRLYPRPKRPNVRATAKRILLTRPITFEGNGATLSPQTFPLLAELADLLANHPEIAHVVVQGHVDARGAPESEQALSEDRARAVRDWLVAYGVTGGRVSAVGYGGTQPLVPNITHSNRSKNRRIELEIR